MNKKNMAAKEFIKKETLEYKLAEYDEGGFIGIDERLLEQKLEEYHQAKLKLLGVVDVNNRFDSKYTPPFRVGRKQGKAVLDANGKEVIFFKDSEEQAKKYCDYLNGC